MPKRARSRRRTADPLAHVTAAIDALADRRCQKLLHMEVGAAPGATCPDCSAPIYYLAPPPTLPVTRAEAAADDPLNLEGGR